MGGSIARRDDFAVSICFNLLSDGMRSAMTSGTDAMTEAGPVAPLEIEDVGGAAAYCCRSRA
jgi:hypothetical protein